MKVRAADLALAAFPVAVVTRTAVGKIETILYRVECWRSFADYALGVLARARKMLRSEGGMFWNGFRGGRGDSASDREITPPSNLESDSLQHGQ
jgi:hypothetical protein